MANAQYSFTSELWKWEARASWYFVSLPEAISDEIEAMYGALAGGFGSLRVKVTVGGSRWSTSIFPDGKRATYVLPVKKPVRIAEGLADGDPVHIDLVIAS
ncbi:MAG: hypothetical protein JWQ39_2092 [Glaciihabitans sp.]|nr:hypothetical protein [Glaciihabitans sp.]